MDRHGNWGLAAGHRAIAAFQTEGRSNSSIMGAAERPGCNARPDEVKKQRTQLEGGSAAFERPLTLRTRHEDVGYGP